MSEQLDRTSVARLPVQAVYEKAMLCLFANLTFGQGKPSYLQESIRWKKLEVLLNVAMSLERAFRLQGLELGSSEDVENAWKPLQHGQLFATSRGWRTSISGIFLGVL